MQWRNITKEPIDFKFGLHIQSGNSSCWVQNWGQILWALVGIAKKLLENDLK